MEIIYELGQEHILIQNKISSFKIYSTIEKEVEFTYSRLENDDVVGELMEYSINPQDSAILYFVVYLNGVYTIYFIYLVDSTSEEV